MYDAPWYNAYVYRTVECRKVGIAEEYLRIYFSLAAVINRAWFFIVLKNGQNGYKVYSKPIALKISGYSRYHSKTIFISSNIVHICSKIAHKTLIILAKIQFFV